MTDTTTRLHGRAGDLRMLIIRDLRATGPAPTILADPITGLASIEMRIRRSHRTRAGSPVLPEGETLARLSACEVVFAYLANGVNAFAFGIRFDETGPMLSVCAPIALYQVPDLDVDMLAIEDDILQAPVRLPAAPSRDHLRALFDDCRETFLSQVNPALEDPFEISPLADHIGRITLRDGYGEDDLEDLVVQICFVFPHDRRTLLGASWKAGFAPDGTRPFVEETSLGASGREALDLVFEHLAPVGVVLQTRGAFSGRVSDYRPVAVRKDVFVERPSALERAEALAALDAFARDRLRVEAPERAARLLSLLAAAS